MAELVEIPTLPIRILARGKWLHGNDPLHPRVEALFKRNVVPCADGTYMIVLGRDRHPVHVEDTAFFVLSLRCIESEASGDLEAVELTLSDEQVELLAPETLMQSADNVLYCRVVRCGLLVPCRFSPGQYHELALCAELKDDRPVLCVGGQRYAFEPYDPSPKTVRP